MVKRESKFPLNMQPQKKPQKKLYEVVEEQELEKLRGDQVDRSTQGEKKQSQVIMEQPQLEKLRGDRVEASSHADTSSREEFQAKWVEGSHTTIPPSVKWGDLK